MHNSPKYNSSNDEDKDFVPDSVDSDSSVSECSETSDDSSVENEDVEDDATDNGTENATEISDSDEWVDITDAVPNFVEYDGDPTINVPVTAETPTDFYKLFVTEEIIDKMVNETNKYAENYINNSQANTKPKSHVKAWTPTDPQEMKL